MNPTPFDRPGTQPSPLFTPGTERAGVSRVGGASASVKDLFIGTAKMSERVFFGAFFSGFVLFWPPEGWPQEGGLGYV